MSEIKKLVDAEELYLSMEGAYTIFDKNDLDWIYKFVKEAPAVDAVRHGQWMSSGGFSGDECTECAFSGEMDSGARYCPSCGAKMDGVSWID